MIKSAMLVIGLAAMATGGAATAADSPTGLVQLAQADRPLVSGERVRVQKLARDMESAMQTLNEGGVVPFQDPAYVAKWQDAITRYRDSMQKYPQLDDPDVQAAAVSLAELENMVAFGINEAAKQQAELGDVQVILAAIEQNLRDNPAPQWLPAPFGAEEARDWVGIASRARQTAQASIAEIQRVAPSAHLPLNPGTVQQGAAYDQHDVDRLLNWAGGNIQEVDDAVQQTTNALKARFDAQDSELDYYRGLDPENEQHRANAFLSEGAEEEIYGSLDRQLALAQTVVVYQQALGHEPTVNSTARVAEIAALRATYAANRTRALGESRLPDAKSDDPERIAIAGQILANPEYEYGEHGPIVLTTVDIVEREKDVSRAEITDVDFSLSGSITLSGTETSWHYKWREFRFSTPIREPGTGDWYIWWITAKNFSSGWERTPIGEWVSGAATRGDLILEENFAG